MSKHAIDDDDKGDFWKKMRYGAAAAVAFGSGLCAVTSVLKKQGLSSFVDEVKTAMQTAPHLMADITPKVQPDDEARAVLNMQLNFAMERQDMQRVQEISRELDKLEANVSTTQGCVTMMMQPSQMQQMHVPSLQTMHSKQMQIPKQMPSSAPSPAALQMPFQETTSQMPVQQMVSPQMVSSQMLYQQMPVQQMAPALGDTLPLDKTSGDTTMQKEAYKGGNKEAHKEAHKEARPPARQPAEPTPRQAAMQMLQGGDVVEAMDPVTTQWSPAVIHAIAKNGLVEVRWDDPGTDSNGKPFHPIGEVWAEQIRLKCRPASVVALAPQKTAAVVEEEPVTPPDGLQVGDTCYAVGHVVTKNWFAAKLIGVRARSPPMRVEYVATFDGQTAELFLPSPRKGFVHVDQVRRDKPEVEASGMFRRAALEEKAEAKAAEQASQNDATADASREDDVVIPPDLMCVVCERPDDEPNMLVCDCMIGYHIYCLSPPLQKVPDEDWKCPTCAKKK